MKRKSREEDEAKADVDADSNKINKKPSSSSTSTSILAFSMSHSPTKVELLSTNTVYDLVDIACQVSHIGTNGKESVYDHLWYVAVNGLKYESGDFECESDLRATQTALDTLELDPNTQLFLTYDYGTTTNYTFTFLGQSELSFENGDNENDFPRKMKQADPHGYTKHETPDNINLNTSFEALNNWAFPSGNNEAVLNFFQPGKKRNYGYMEQKGQLCHLIFMPAASPKELAEYLHCFDHGLTFKPKTTEEGYPMYDWYSMIVIADEFLTESLSNKWSQNLEPGFVDMKVVSRFVAPSVASAGADSGTTTPTTFNNAFPKVAALAGFKKDSKVPKGWMTYKDGVITICTGSTAVTSPSNAPPGTAMLGADQHEPLNDDCRLFQMDIKIDSLHDLFCVAEGLLRTL